MKQYIDEKKQSHYIGEVFCEDGQGVLYKTKNESILLRDAKDREADRQAFEDVTLLPLSKVDNIILPLYTLESDVGYVVSIPEGFVTLQTIMYTEEEDKQSFYVNTGGLKRRLAILMNLAKILLQLHSLPVMYGSMSANRILISPKPDNSQVYLLYSVGMSYAMDFSQQNNTDAYIAPEMKSGKGGNILSDNYAFAALAYDILTLSNNCLILTEEITALFDKTFKQSDNQADRPKILDFYNVFMKSLDLIIVCKQCNMSIFYGELNCKYCNAPVSKLFKADIYDIISKTKIRNRTKIFEFTTNRQYFYNYHTGTILLSENHEPTLEFLLNISPDKKLHLIFKNLLDKSITINKKEVAAGQAHAVAMPCNVIQISIELYSATVRCIDIVVL